MQKILRIARLELSILFYSPIAWLVLIIFTIQNGIAFTELLYSQETYQQLERALGPMSKVLFAGEKGMLTVVQENLYLYIPLLTMGLLSRETSSGSIKLLLSSPVMIREIVLGKFLAMMVYGLILVAVLLGFTIVGYFSVQSLDVPFVIGGIFGVYMLILAYAAIGLFMSGLTPYQVVAAISTLAVLACLNFMAELGQGTDILRDLTHWLSIAGRTEQMINGMITSKDTIYFILVVLLFLSLTIIKLNSGRKIRSFGFKLMRYAVIILVFIGLGYLSSLPLLTGYFDTTRFKDRTLTEKSQELVKRFSKPVKIVSYTNVIHSNAIFGVPKNRIGDMDRFEMYQRFLPGMKMEYIAYYDTLIHYNDTTKTLLEKAKQASDAQGFDFNELLTPQQIKKKVNLIPEENGFVRFIVYDGKTAPLRMFSDLFTYPLEPEINAALKRLLDQPAVVGMVTGNDERSADNSTERGYKAITKGLDVRASLINQGFNVIDIDLNKSDQIPDSLTVLILADPTVELSPMKLQKINHYLETGGNMLIAGEPGRQHILNPVLAKLGINMIAGTVLEESDNNEPDFVQALFTKQADEYKLSVYDDAKVSLSGVASLAYEPSGLYKKQPILISNENLTWNKTGNFNLKDKIVFDAAKDQKKSYPLALAVTRALGKRQQRIMVLGDADFMSNQEVSRSSPGIVNANFVIKTMKWFSNGVYPISNPRPKAIDTVILISRAGINMQKMFLLGIVPLLIAVWGGVLLIRRKRK
ncbi:Gldg family protein [Pedobacter sp. MC2016-14]|uniref:Gldg family protein n=1 Tax=Pedobacter sp. MC2016-14 TaxID=2897327 RepID=UPI001E2A5B9E|nr:Gldg family protein [Pedobacter sp. MC2016-14]MCD0486980.1 Gldg family protein [Pedobacter sp. MC2016-14]